MSAVSTTSRRALAAALLTLGFLVAGAGAFDRAAVAGGAGADLSGRWTAGSWESSKTPHHGNLGATMTRIDGGYRCVFHGTFAKFVPFRYAVDLKITGYGPGRVYFSATKDLPLFGGSFTCCGSATCSCFTAKYTSPEDSGLFKLSR